MSAAPEYTHGELRAWRDTLTAEIEGLRRRQREDAERERRLRVDRDRITKLFAQPRVGPRENYDEWYVRCEEVAAYVREWRAQDGHTLRILAELSGVSQRGVNRILNPADRSYSPRVIFSTAERLLRAMGMEERIGELAFIPKEERDRLVYAEKAARAAGERIRGPNGRWLPQAAVAEQRRREQELQALTGY